jgi:hypothetical protein
MAKIIFGRIVVSCRIKDHKEMSISENKWKNRYTGNKFRLTT